MAEKRDTPISSFKRLMIHRLLAILDARESFLKEPKEPAYVHQLRVSLRQARSLLSLMKPFLKGKKLDKAQDILRILAHSLAHLRELDVLKNSWEDFLKEHSGVSYSDPFTDALRQMRENELAIALPSIENLDTEDAIRSLLSWVNEWDDQYKHKKYLLQTVAKRIKTWIKIIRAGITSLNVNNLVRAHRLRITVKKMRYVLECLPGQKEGLALNSAQLELLQKDLGIVCDIHIHLQVLEKLSLRVDLLGSDQAVALFICSLKSVRDEIGANLNKK